MKSRNLFSLVLVFIFALTSVIACFPGSIASASEIELADDDINNAASVLKAICPQYPLDNAEITTRAEFVAAVTMAMNIPEGTLFESSFTDVPEKHPYANHIGYAAKTGLISNVALFYPDVSVTYAQAIKIVMEAAGYGKKAQYSGGFPTGYLKLARDINVGQGINLGPDDAVSHEMATRIIFEACCADLMEQVSFGSFADYAATKGKNIFSVYHNVLMTEGIVEANENTGLDAAFQASAGGFVVVDGETYKSTSAQKFLGKRVCLFYRDDNSKTVVYAYEKGNKITEYTSEDALSLTGTVISAFASDETREHRHTLDADYKFIYNGKAYIAADYASKLNPASGTVSLIDNDDDNKIDVVCIKSMEYGVIGSVNAPEGKIYDKYKKNSVIDLFDNDVVYSITDSQGTELVIEQLEAENKIGYVISVDKKYIEIIRCDNAVGGVYTSLTSDGKIEVKETEYKLSEYYTENVKRAETIKMSTEIILYLSPDNQVIWIQEFTTSLNYGFLQAVAQKPGIDGNILVRIFTADGEMLEAAVADKIVLDGQSKTSETEIKAFFDAVVSKQHAYRVIKYSVNSEGKVNKIYTATDNAEGSSVIYSQPNDEARPVIFYNSTEVSGEISDDSSVAVPYVLDHYQCPFPVYGSFSYFHSGSETKIMRIPVRPSQFNDDDNFKIITSVPAEYLRTAAYDVTYGGIASFILVSTDTTAGGIGTYDGSAIIESITKGVNEEGEEHTIIKLFAGNNWGKYYYHPEKTRIYKEKEGGSGTEPQTELTLNDFGPGDIIRFSADSKNVLGEITMNYDASSKTVAQGLTQTDGNNGRYVEYIKGYALGFNQNRVLLATDNTIEEIDALGGNIDISNVYSGALTRGTTVFVKYHRNRASGEITSAEVYKEASASAMETYFTSGRGANYVVLRQYFREPILNVIYVNADE